MLRILNPRWRKVFRDIWGNKARTVLVVLAIAVGVFAFGGVFITQDVLIADMNSGYAGIKPASITLSGSNFDEAVVRSVAGARPVVDAQGRASLSVKLQSGPEDWVNLDMYAVPDFDDIRINQITLEDGPWPPGRRQLYLERKSAALLGVEVGDTVLIELADGSQKELTLAGIVHDFNAIPANLFPQLTGFASLETLEWLGHPGTYNEISVVTQPGITDVDELEKIGRDLVDRLSRDGYEASFQTQDPSKHWAADGVTAITTLLGVIGSFSLVLSGFLVVNTISAVIGQQKRQIGMMKSVGAENRQVFAIYMVMIGLFGALSLLVALPTGRLLALGITTIIADFLNVDILHFRIPPSILLLQIGIALVAPLISGFIPVMTGIRVTVREAVSDYGIGMAQKQGFVDLLLARIRGLSRPTLLSIRNTFRRKGRLILTLITLTMAGAIFISVLSVRTSFFIELDKILRLFQYDVQLALDGAYPVARLQREAQRVDEITHVEGWAFGQAVRIRDDNEDGYSFIIFGPPADTPFINATIEEGRWLEPGDENAIVLGSEVIKEEPDIHVGDEITLEIGGVKRKWNVVGIVSLPGIGFAYADFDYFSRVLGAPGQSFVLIGGTQQHDSDSQSRVMRALEERLKLSGIGVTQSLTRETIIGAQVQQVNFLIYLMLFMAVLLAIVGGLGLAGTMSLNVLERTREIGVVRAIGASNPAISSIVLAEGIIIGMMSWALGAIISVPMSLLMDIAIGNAFFQRPLDFAYEPRGVAYWLVIALVIATIASLLPARRASSISVREALAYE